MQTLESLLNDISITKLLNYFGYRLSSATPKFNTYTKVNDSHQFYIFHEIDSDAIQSFSSALYRKVLKTELLFLISGAETISNALTLIPKISGQPALDSNVNITIPIPVNTLINLLATLVEPDGEILPITKTSQFKRRIFLTPDGYYKTPLFHHHLDQPTSNRIVNFVKWNETQTHFLNSNAFCLNATFYSDANRFLFLTCSPVVWMNFPTRKHSPDYFQLLCHPEAPITFFKLTFDIFKKYKFLKCLLHIGHETTVNNFSGKALAFFINQFFPKFFFNIHYSSERFFIEITYLNSRELNIEIAKLFTNVSYELHEHFFSGLQDQFEIPPEVANMTSFESEKFVVGEKVTIVESISGQGPIALAFLNIFLRHLKLDQQLEVILL